MCAPLRSAAASPVLPSVDFSIPGFSTDSFGAGPGLLRPPFQVALAASGERRKLAIETRVAVWLRTAAFLVALNRTAALAQGGPDNGSPPAGPQVMRCIGNFIAERGWQLLVPIGFHHSPPTHRAPKQKTAGKLRPMGERGAFVADHVAGGPEGEKRAQEH